MTAEAQQRYHADIKTEDVAHPNISQFQKEVLKLKAILTLNLEDWSISYKEYRPGKSKNLTNKTMKQDKRR
jgi:hypothetical protein